MNDLATLEARLRELIKDYVQMGAHRSKKIVLVREFTLGQITGIEEALNTLGHGDVVEQVHREMREDEATPERQLARVFLTLFSGRHKKRNLGG